MSNSSNRRVPTQARSKRRVETILSAAAELFAAHGVDQVTTDDIAKKAGTSLGSIYQFFGNKDDIFQALVDRSRDAERVLFGTIAARGQDTPWPELVELMIDGFANLQTRDPLYLAVARNARLLAKDPLAHEQFALGIESLIQFRAPWLEEDRARRIAIVAVEITSAVLNAADQCEDGERALMIEEAKTVLLAYFSIHVKR